MDIWKIGRSVAMAMAATAFAFSAAAAPPQYPGPSGTNIPGQGVFLIDPLGLQSGVSGNPVHITCDSGCSGGGGGGGAVTGAAGSFVDGWSVTQGALGDTACATDNGSCSAIALAKRGNQRITSLIGVMGSPFQAGGSIGNTSFGISGTLPAFAATPTFNIGTAPTITVTGTITANVGTSGSLALDTSVTGLQVSQGSTSSGQKGSLVQCAVTTSAPSYTTAQTSPCSLTPAGAIRTDSSATTQPVSGTVAESNLPSTVDTNAGNPSANTIRNVQASFANFSPSQVSVANTATLLSAARSARGELTIINTGTVAVYLGGSGVTTSTGELLAGVVGASRTIRYTGALYGIVSTGTQTVTVTEVY